MLQSFNNLWPLTADEPASTTEPSPPPQQNYAIDESPPAPEDDSNSEQPRMPVDVAAARGEASAHEHETIGASDTWPDWLVDDRDWWNEPVRNVLETISPDRTVVTSETAIDIASPLEPATPPSTSDPTIGIATAPTPPAPPSSPAPTAPTDIATSNPSKPTAAAPIVITFAETEAPDVSSAPTSTNPPPVQPPTIGIADPIISSTPQPPPPSPPSTDLSRALDAPLDNVSIAVAISASTFDLFA